MPQFSTKRRVKHSAADMFDLVADVERYPEFVPLCRAMRVMRRIKTGDREVVVAQMTLDRERLQIGVEYLDGPFSRMENQWHFHPAAETMCDVEFFIAYEFKSRTLGLLMGAMFDVAFRRFASAFEHRADLVFGRAGTA
jgi:coenzyme Q-binding protein COQ10